MLLRRSVIATFCCLGRILAISWQTEETKRPLRGASAHIYIHTHTSVSVRQHLFVRAKRSSYFLEWSLCLIWIKGSVHIIHKYLSSLPSTGICVSEVYVHPHEHDWGWWSSVLLLTASEDDILKNQQQNPSVIHPLLLKTLDSIIWAVSRYFNIDKLSTILIIDYWFE